MRRSLILLTLLLAVLASPGSLPESSRRALDPQKIYITSFFDCEVYWRGKKIAVLPKGTRAQIVRSTKHWILVRFQSGAKYITGWIRR